MLGGNERKLNLIQNPTRKGYTCQVLNATHVCACSRMFIDLFYIIYLLISTSIILYTHQKPFHVRQVY